MSETEDHDGGSVPGAPQPPKLRRGMFGYRREDVEAALAERDQLLAELRQDVAALWLAFAQHDRMIREIRGESPAERAAAPRAPAPAHDPPAPAADAAAAAEGAETIGKQLADLDEVLAAIEMATKTLERSYAEEIAAEPVEDAEGEASDERDAPAV